ncbi:MAG: UbiD family decarboxylase [Phycisphaerales bacterium]|nr:UbiD family decarboxylase [Phycisphaerales bacterium]
MPSLLEKCIHDLEKINQLKRVKTPVDPYLEMSAIQLRMYEQQGPALLFENIIGSKYRAVSNLFGTIERSRYLFRNTLPVIEELLALRINPINAVKHPFKLLHHIPNFINGIPKKVSLNILNQFDEIKISDLPHIHHWQDDGGAFITLPQVYSEDIEIPGIKKSNLGMYRIQLSGNDYIPNEEIGLHYQLHRGIGIHQKKTNDRGIPLKVSCFVGGHPAHSFAAVMPLPEGISELHFAGLLANRRFRYTYYDGYLISTDADFIILGEVLPNYTKLEGPFGDHLGYYSLKHPFPVIKVKKVLARKNAIWTFTVVGRPPQEDTSFGKIIHEITANVLPKEVPGLIELNAVDAAGVHPLLLAIGQERYTPYLTNKKPSEILTIAHRILGTGQLSLAKYLWIAEHQIGMPSVHQPEKFLPYCLERIDLQTDLHFETCTSIDTLDYSSVTLHEGSKLVLAVAGDKKRTLKSSLSFDESNYLIKYGIAKICLPGILCIQTKEFVSYTDVAKDCESLWVLWSLRYFEGIVLVVLVDDITFVNQHIHNFLWVTFTRSDPAKDIHGFKERVIDKHWGCSSPLLIDARSKPHHAPPLKKKSIVEESVDKILRDLV